MTDTSDEFLKALDGTGSSDEGTTPGQQTGDKGTSVTPPSAQTIKVGDREYSTEDLEKRLTLADEVEKLEKEQNIDFKNLKSDYTKKSMELAEIKKKVEPIENAFNKSRETQGEELPEDYEEFRARAKKYGLVLQDDVKPLSDEVGTLRQERIKVEEESKRQRLATEIKELAEKYPFVKWDGQGNLQEYMLKKADEGVNLSPEDAARLLYSDEFAVIKAKELGYTTPRLPQTDASGQRGEGLPSGKKLDFETGGISDALEENLNTNPVQ